MQMIQAKLDYDEIMKLDEDLLANQDYSPAGKIDAKFVANKIRRKVNFSELVSDEPS